MNILQEVLKLEDGESYIVPESDYGKAEIWKKNDIYFLFEIPMYGGLPVYSGNYIKHQLDKMVAVINSWS